MSKNHALLSITVPLVAGTAALRSAIQQISKIGSIHTVSSVYKRYLNGRAEDLNSELVTVLKIETSLSHVELNQALLTKMLETFTQHKVQLLNYNSLVSLNPDLPLPSPILYGDHVVLTCAAEAWGVYEHPVLGETLNQLLKSATPGSNAEFFGQSRILTEREAS